MTTHNTTNTTNTNCSSVAAKFRRIVQRFQASSPPSTGGTPAVVGPAMYGALPYRPTGVDHVQGYTIVRFSDGDSVYLRGHFPQGKAFERAVEIRKAEQRGKFPAQYGRWVTMGGGEGEGSGGARVFIEDDGTIAAGPAALTGKKIGELKKEKKTEAKEPKPKEKKPFEPVKISGQYSTLSRGRIVAKHMKTGTWGDRGNGNVTLDKPGKWMISQTDGFNRKETVYVDVNADGEITGLGRRMQAHYSRSPLHSALSTMVRAISTANPAKYGRWVTIGGSKEEGEDGKVKGRGGARVYIEDDGTITAGPSKLEGKKIGELDKNVAGTAKDKRKDNEPPVPKDANTGSGYAGWMHKPGEGKPDDAKPGEDATKGKEGEGEAVKAAKPPEKAPKPPKPPKADLHNALLQEGRRLYVQGDTYPIRQKLRDAGFTWDADKRQWYIGSQKKDDANKLMTRLFGESQRQQWEDLTKSTLQPQQPEAANQPSKPAATAALPSTLREENGRLYVQGSNTYDYREKLKAAGFRWDGDRKKWYIDARHKNHAIETVSGMKKLDQAKTPSEDVTRAKSTGQGSSGSRSGRHENPSTPEEIKQSATKWAEKLGRKLVEGSEPKRWTASGLGKGDDGAENGTIRERNGKYYMQIGRTPRQYYSQDMLEDMDEFNMKPGGAYEWTGVEVEPDEAERAKRATIESEKSRRAAFEEARKKAIHKDFAKAESRASWGDFGGAGWKETPEEFKDRTGMVKIPTGSTNSDLYTDGDRLISGSHVYDMGSNYAGTTDKEAIREVLRHAPSTKEIDELRAKLGIEPAKYSRSPSRSPLRSRLFRTISRVLAE